MPRKASLSLAFIIFSSAALLSQPIPTAVLSVAQARYVRVQTYKVEKQPNGSTTETVSSEATGFVVGEDLALINFHALTVDQKFMANGQKVGYVRIDPELDLVLVRVKLPKMLPWINVTDAEIGRVVYGLSNTDGLDRFLVHHFVSKLDSKFLYFQDPVTPGESGTGFLNESGKLVGLAEQSQQSEGDNKEARIFYGQAIPGSIIRQFLKGLLPEGKR